jgi:hypothetical protein
MMTNESFITLLFRLDFLIKPSSVEKRTHFGAE